MTHLNWPVTPDVEADADPPRPAQASAGVLRWERAAEAWYGYSQNYAVAHVEPACASKPNGRGCWCLVLPSTDAGTVGSIDAAKAAAEDTWLRWCADAGLAPVVKP